MKIFLDTADLSEIRRAADAGLIDGITTNPSLVAKVPLTEDGLKACSDLVAEGHKVNVTLCFSVSQALLAAKAGATFVSPFVGRLDDISGEGMKLISQIREVYDNYGFDTEILAASLRHPMHVVECMLIGADCCTLPPKVLWQLSSHPLTDKGLVAFLKDWDAAGTAI